MASVEGTEQSSSWDLEDHIRGTIYGQCIGDAVGLLTEFMCKEQATNTYAEHEHLEYEHKVRDMHRVRWENGDWTDDSDQMILIMQSLLANNGKAEPVDFANRLLDWAQHGFEELGDKGGMGIGATTKRVLQNEMYKTDPHAAAESVWRYSGCVVAPNGAVMRTSILGINEYQDINNVAENAKALCKITHADPRCIASCVAVVGAIAMMLQRYPKHLDHKGEYNLDLLIKDAYTLAKPYLKGKKYKKHKNEMKKYMFAKTLSEMDLDEKQSIGYTYKALGAGFWVLRQQDFRTAIEALVLEGGDADSNGSVAGALLGCKLGAQKLPPTWRDGLLHKPWLDDIIDRFLVLQKIKPPTEEQEESKSE